MTTSPLTHIPAPAEVRNFPDDNPKAKIVSDRGRLRVVTREYYWDTEAKRGKERRKYIGYIVNGAFLSNDEYHKHLQAGGEKCASTVRPTPKPSPAARPSRRVIAGGLPLLHTVAIETGLMDDLEKAWNRDAAGVILSAAAQLLLTGSQSPRLFESWQQNRLLPLRYPVSATEMNRILVTVASSQESRRKFFAARAARLGNEKRIEIDVTDAVRVVRTPSGGIVRDIFWRQTGLVLETGLTSGVPVSFHIPPGKLTNVASLPDFFPSSMTGNVLPAVMGEEHFSWELAEKLFDQGRPALLWTDHEDPVIREVMKKAADELTKSAHKIPGTDCFGMTVEVNRPTKMGRKRMVPVHIFLDQALRSEAMKALFGSIETFEADWKEGKASSATRKALMKSPFLKFHEVYLGEDGMYSLKRLDDMIDAVTPGLGVFAVVSTKPCEPAEVLSAYRSAELIRKCFRPENAVFDPDVNPSHLERIVTGRFIVSFVALTIATDVARRLEAAFPRISPVGHGWQRGRDSQRTAVELRHQFDTVTLCRFEKSGWQWEGVTDAHKSLAAALRIPRIFTALPIWGLPG
ncbi:hypothetical protein [Sutterella sp.]|uniref:hypothetical protein n=1 Tax=Sutterella sp. TaxID=1981025 RepID=UPI0026E0B320|nr:hypothetical protein [Sutterella sp.]MDO5532346.1 hypothetical protein [Sutterella sp.]